MKTIILLLTIITATANAKVEVQPWTPQPIEVEIGGETYLYYPPYEHSGCGEEM